MKAAELCAGYGGLALAVEEVFDAETAWVSEFEGAPSKILAHHWPAVPNYGDMTKIDWSAVEPVDIISGGTPCQDLSAAGRRRGMTEGTRSNLWVQMREAIATIQPTYVVWENVRGAYSAGAYSELEQSEGRVGEDGNPYLRALWEQALGRRAPAPTEPTGRNGGHRLSARFAEWMMGMPEGWIVDVPGITRNEALKAAGNGVVPQQAIAAMQDMLSTTSLPHARTHSK